MAEEQVTRGQESPRLSKNSKLLGFLFAFICIGGSVAIFGVVVFLRKDCPDCKQRSPILVAMLAILGTLLFFLGLSILTAFCRRRRNSSTLPPQVVMSSIPAEDLENSPAPIRPGKHVAYGRLVVIEASSLDLPGYFTAVQNTDAVNSSAEAGFWKDDLDIRPPSYEQAVALDDNILQ
ncbi:uncharacterized protein LOC144631238 [Oculina patagonica]